MMDVPSICREQSPVAFRHDPNADAQLGEEDTRLEDYLNDKIQTRADLASLASLIQTVELQKKQLEEQVGSRNSLRVACVSELIICIASRCQSQIGTVKTGLCEPQYPDPPTS